MATVRVPRESKERLEQEVTSSVDPTALPVWFQFLPRGDRPTEDAWTIGSWKAGGGPRKFTALTPTLGGPDSGSTLELEPGRYVGWYRVEGNPERPVHVMPDQLIID